MQTHQEIVRTLEAKGFTIHENTPITFTGFPFKLIAHQQAFTAIRKGKKIGSKISSTNTIIKTSIFKPLRWDIKGNIKLEGHFAPAVIPFTTSKITKKELNAHVGLQVNEYHDPVNLGLTTPHLRLKFALLQGKLQVKSVKLHDFKIRWEDPWITKINYMVVGQSGKYTLSPFIQTETDASYKIKFKFNNFEVQKFDLKKKESYAIALHRWTGKIKLKGGTILQIFGKLGDIILTAVDKRSNTTFWCKFSGSLVDFATQQAYSLEKAETDKEYIKIESKIVQSASEIRANGRIQLKQGRLILDLGVKSEEGIKAAMRIASFIAQLPASLIYKIDNKDEPNLLPTEWKSDTFNKEFDLTEYFTDPACKPF